MAHDPTGLPAGIGLLEDAFRSFGQATMTLEASYHALRERVERLDMELADRNEALQSNLIKTEEIRSRLDAILESLSTGVIVADQDGRVVRCNRAAETLLGTDQELLVGRSLGECLRRHRLDRKRYPLVTQTGACVSVSRAIPRFADGQPAGNVVLIHDITAVRELEDRLHRRDRLASMGEMVGRIAHEIRNPLGSVELFASMLRQDLADRADLRVYTEHISLAVGAMDRLLTNLLTYTRPASPKIGWHMTADMVEDAMTLAAHALRGARVMQSLRLKEAPPMVRCDRAQMTQALLNLVLNAVEAMPDGGCLTIGVSSGMDRYESAPVVRFAVTDTGRGIEPAHLPRLFDPFFTTREEGTGLGLAIVHTIVDGHGGRVEVESVPKRGSTVTLVLPQHEADGLHEAQGASAVSAGGRARKRS